MPGSLVSLFSCDIRARTVDQNRELWYTARNRSWPPHGVSYDQVRKTRMYRLF
jgi:hypothetical protein